MSDKLLLTVLEAADMLSIGRSMVYDLITSGDLRIVKIGRATRIRVSDIKALIDSLPTELEDDRANNRERSLARKASDKVMK